MRLEDNVDLLPGWNQESFLAAASKPNDKSSPVGAGGGGNKVSLSKPSSVGAKPAAIDPVSEATKAKEEAKKQRDLCKVAYDAVMQALQKKPKPDLVTAMAKSLQANGLYTKSKAAADRVLTFSNRTGYDAKTLASLKALSVDATKYANEAKKFSSDAKSAVKKAYGTGTTTTTTLAVTKTPGVSNMPKSVTLAATKAPLTATTATKAPAVTTKPGASALKVMASALKVMPLITTAPTFQPVPPATTAPAPTTAAPSQMAQMLAALQGGAGGMPGMGGIGQGVGQQGIPSLPGMPGGATPGGPGSVGGVNMGGGGGGFGGGLYPGAYLGGGGVGAVAGGPTLNGQGILYPPGGYMGYNQLGVVTNGAIPPPAGTVAQAWPPLSTTTYQLTPPCSQDVYIPPTVAFQGPPLGASQQFYGQSIGGYGGQPRPMTLIPPSPAPRIRPPGPPVRPDLDPIPDGPAYVQQQA